MKKTLLVFTLILGFTSALAAQNLYLARDFIQGYANGTRSKDGNPGPDYWQNSANYNIKAEVNPPKNQLKGEEQITYYNNSPDTLNEIVFKIYQNVFERGKARDSAVFGSDVDDSTKISYIAIGNKQIDQSDYSIYKPSGTILTVVLQHPLLPGEKRGMEVHWKLRIPEKTNMRIGKGDETSFFVGYWYPKIAVYDDIHGWDRTRYTGRLEFYNNYGDYKVSIKAPSNYGVWATGMLQNPNEVYAKSFAKRVDQAFAADSLTHLITAEDYKKEALPFNNASDTNTWKYEAEHVPEVAFTFGDHYIWDATSITLPDNRRVQVSSVYRQSGKDFVEVAELARKAIDFYSETFPGVPYPFPQMTVVHGKSPKSTSGMEFSMMCNNPSAPHRGRTVDVTAHEIAHTYFPFYVGVNEHDYAWMDEGWATMLPVDYLKNNAPSFNRLTQYAGRTSQHDGYMALSLPMMTPSTSLNDQNYMLLSYGKPVMAYNFLREELGDKLYTKVLQGYINRWKYKHPTPYDFFYSFNDLSGRNLNWFWKSWFFEVHRPNLAITNVKKEGNDYKVKITNKGGLPLPIALKITYSDGSSKDIYKTVGVWENGDRSAIIDVKGSITEMELGNAYIPDIAPDDNTYQMNN